MAKSVLDIVIKLSKTGNAPNEVVTGLTKVKTAMMDAAVVAGAFVAAGYTIKKAFDATVGTMVAYADQVRSIQQTTGLTAEESSRLIQVLDDMKISYEDLQKVVAKNGDQFDYSIQGLSRMSDEYRSLKDAQEKADFMQEHFGKNWKVFVEAMEQGGEKLRKAGEAINEGLILDEAALREAREYEENLDELNDKTQGWAISIGSDLVPALNNQIDVEARVQQLMAEGVNHYTARARATQEAIILQKLETSAASKADAARWNGLASLYASTEATNGLAGALDAVEVNYSDILGMATKVADEDRSYADAVKAVNDDINLTTDERKAKLDELAAKHNEVTNKIIGDNFLQKLSVDGLEQAEFEMFLAYQIGTGQMTQAQADQAAAFNELTTMAAGGKLSVDEMRAAIELLQDKTVTLTVEQVVNTVTNGGGQMWDFYGGPRAAGGPVNKGKTYLVGESGPEMFVPGQSGIIVPNSSMGGGSGSGGVGGGVVVVNLVMNSVISNMDKEMAKNTLTPFIKQGIREAQAQGMIK